MPLRSWTHSALLKWQRQVFVFMSFFFVDWQLRTIILSRDCIRLLCSAHISGPFVQHLSQSLLLVTQARPRTIPKAAAKASAAPAPAPAAAPAQETVEAPDVLYPNKDSQIILICWPNMWTFIDHDFWTQGCNRHRHSLDLRQLILQMARLRQVPSAQWAQGMWQFSICSWIVKAMLRSLWNW